MPDDPALSSPPRVDQNGRTNWLYVRLAFGFWYLFGLLPAIWAIGRASVRTDFNLNAALGAFGDSFASVTSLMTTVTVIAVGYQILRDRELKQADEVAREAEMKHQAELAMLTILMQARIALASEIRTETHETLGEMKKAYLNPKLKANLDSYIKILFRTKRINSHEINDIMKSAETILGFEKRRYDPEGNPVEVSNGFEPESP